MARAAVVGLIVEPTACLLQGGWTALSRAAFRGHAEVVKQLCTLGADRDIMNAVSPEESSSAQPTPRTAA